MKCGKDSYSPLFSIVREETEAFDRKHFVVGYLKGTHSLNLLHCVLAVIAKNDVPLHELLISNCGKGSGVDLSW